MYYYQVIPLTILLGVLEGLGEFFGVERQSNGLNQQQQLLRGCCYISYWEPI